MNLITATDDHLLVGAVKNLFDYQCLTAKYAMVFNRKMVSLQEHDRLRIFAIALFLSLANPAGAQTIFSNANAPKNGTVALDFNKATNPLCATMRS
jgi:uncharacterized protein (DUF1684 family)